MTLAEKIDYFRDVRQHAMELCDVAAAKLTEFNENPTNELRDEALRTCSYVRDFCRVVSGATLEMQQSL